MLAPSYEDKPLTLKEKLFYGVVSAALILFVAGVGVVLFWLGGYEAAQLWVLLVLLALFFGSAGIISLLMCGLGLIRSKI